MLFADRNVGAESPEDYGDYFQWGDTQVRYSDISAYESYNGDYSFKENNCIWHIGSSNTTGWTKYIPTDKASYWSGNGDPDNLTTLEASDDVASVLWGGDWRMPDIEELQLLIDSDVEVEFVSNYNSTRVSGLLITGKASFASAFVFLPAAGYLSDNKRTGAGNFGYYSSRSLDAGNPKGTRYLYIQDGYWGDSSQNRYYGQSVRPVLIVPSSWL